MILTNKQEEGLKLCIQRYKERRPYTCIAGYAGTGKSTLVKFIIDALELDRQKEVSYVAFTGKAAKVLSQKGCPNATTAHQLLYKSKQKPNGFYFREPKVTLDNRNLKLIVVDEVSMIPSYMWNLLMSHRIPVICCGDPEQLPPINPEYDNHVLDYPHVFLDQIMRQAEESEIIRLSMHVRQGRDLDTFRGENKEVKILHRNAIVKGMYDWADQIICATNRKRNDINNAVRLWRGFAPTPQLEDKVISLSNHWDMYSPSGVPLTNGSIGTLNSFYVESIPVPLYISDKPIEVMWADITMDDGEKYVNIPIDYQQLLTGEPTISPEIAYKMKHAKKCIDPPFDFAYGYGISGHKSQGSEWNKVLAFEENHPTKKDEHRRWLYTVITRASERIVLLKK